MGAGAAESVRTSNGRPSNAACTRRHTSAYEHTHNMLTRSARMRAHTTPRRSLRAVHVLPGEALATLHAMAYIGSLLAGTSALHVMPDGSRTKPEPSKEVVKEQVRRDAWCAGQGACSWHWSPAWRRRGGGSCIIGMWYAHPATCSSAPATAGALQVVKLAVDENLVTPYTSSVGVLLQRNPLDPTKTEHIQVCRGGALCCLLAACVGPCRALARSSLGYDAHERRTHLHVCTLHITRRCP